MSSKKSNNVHGPGSVEARIDVLVAGLQSIPDTTSLDVVGNYYVPSKLSATLTAKKALFVAADQARVNWKEAVAGRNASQADTLALVEAVEGTLRTHFGATSAQLLAFGIAPRKSPRTLTPEERLARAQKARATRAAKKNATSAPSPAPKTGGTTA